MAQWPQPLLVLALLLLLYTASASKEVRITMNEEEVAFHLFNDAAYADDIKQLLHFTLARVKLCDDGKQFQAEVALTTVAACLEKFGVLRNNMEPHLEAIRAENFTGFKEFARLLMRKNRTQYEIEWAQLNCQNFNNFFESIGRYKSQFIYGLNETDQMLQNAGYHYIAKDYFLHKYSQEVYVDLVKSFNLFLKSLYRQNRHVYFIQLLWTIFFDVPQTRWYMTVDYMQLYVSLFDKFSAQLVYLEGPYRPDELKNPSETLLEIPDIFVKTVPYYKGDLRIRQDEGSRKYVVPFVDIMQTISKNFLCEYPRLQNLPDFEAIVQRVKDTRKPEMLLQAIDKIERMQLLLYLKSIVLKGKPKPKLTKIDEKGESDDDKQHQSGDATKIPDVAKVTTQSAPINVMPSKFSDKSKSTSQKKKSWYLKKKYYIPAGLFIAGKAGIYAYNSYIGRPTPGSYTLFDLDQQVFVTTDRNINVLTTRDRRRTVLMLSIIMVIVIALIGGSIFIYQVITELSNKKVDVEQGVPRAESGKTGILVSSIATKGTSPKKLNKQEVKPVEPRYFAQLQSRQEHKDWKAATSGSKKSAHDSSKSATGSGQKSKTGAAGSKGCAKSLTSTTVRSNSQ